MSDAIERMARALEEQNRLHNQELEQARLDEAARLELALAERERAKEERALCQTQERYNRLIEQLLAEIRALIEATETLLDNRFAKHEAMSDRIDAILELQRVVVARMLRDVSDKGEFDRIAQILRHVAGSSVNIQSGGVSMEAGRDAALSAGEDVRAGN